MRQADLKAFLNPLDASTRQIVSALRKVIRRAVPETEESLLWRGLSYHRPLVGGRVKGAVCHIAVKCGEVRLDFIHGVRLTDPSGLLQGNRLSKRFVRIETVAAAEDPGIAALIQEAAALTWA